MANFSSDCVTASEVGVGARSYGQNPVVGVHCITVLHSNVALVGHPMCSQGHIHTSNMLRGGVSMVVIMSHVIGNALEWFPRGGAGGRGRNAPGVG